MKQKFKQIAKVLLSCLVISSLSCENEESHNINQTLTQGEKIIDAEKWFNAYKSEQDFLIAFKNIDYYWENASVIPLNNNSMAIAVPIKDNPEDPKYKGQKMLYLYPSGSKYQSVIQEIFPESESDIDDNIKKVGFENLNSFTGYIITWDLKKGFIKGAQFKNDVITGEVQDAKMILDVDVTGKAKHTGKMEPMFDEGDGVGAERVLTTRGGTTAVPLNNVIVVRKSPAPTPKDYSIGGAFGSSGTDRYLNSPSGGSGRNTTTEGSNLVEVYTPPSCESFNFTSKKGANWQEAAVKNITLRIVILTKNRAEITHTMIFPQAVLFGMPINFNKGNGNVTAGAAATVSAMVLDETMKEMAKLYSRTLTNELTLRTEFQRLLINNYRIYTNGGTVNFNSTSALPATNYKTNPRATGLCDN